MRYVVHDELFRYLSEAFLLIETFGVYLGFKVDAVCLEVGFRYLDAFS